MWSLKWQTMMTTQSTQCTVYIVDMQMKDIMQRWRWWAYEIPATKTDLKKKKQVEFRKMNHSSNIFHSLYKTVFLYICLYFCSIYSRIIHSCHEDRELFNYYNLCVWFSLIENRTERYKKSRDGVIKQKIMEKKKGSKSSERRWGTRTWVKCIIKNCKINSILFICSLCFPFCTVNTYVHMDIVLYHIHLYFLHAYGVRACGTLANVCPPHHHTQYNVLNTCFFYFYNNQDDIV